MSLLDLERSSQDMYDEYYDACNISARNDVGQICILIGNNQLQANFTNWLAAKHKKN